MSTWPSAEVEAAATAATTGVVTMGGYSPENLASTHNNLKVQRVNVWKAARHGHR